MVTQEERAEILQGAINKWGEALQMDMVIEECAELIQAINKLRRGKDGAISNVREELADVQIMIDQMRLIFDNECIQQRENDKLIRLANRLGIIRKEDSHV